MRDSLMDLEYDDFTRSNEINDLDEDEGVEAAESLPKEISSGKNVATENTVDSEKNMSKTDEKTELWNVQFFGIDQVWNIRVEHVEEISPKPMLRQSAI